ncbi:hypothetical protein [Jatrophihabitans sp.]|uniref:hypothetical protein n=1 Tax=Jatrophihabitans sp. TaxID=1932789 RepID=UPI0030C757CE|nr:hypothetical protein [Jatrophihabitans sp.]
MSDDGYAIWPEPARTMAQGVDAAVAAARAADAAAFAEATTALRRVDREQLWILLGEMTRDLLERSHPDGLESEDAEEILRSCIRATAGWYVPLDSDALIRALTGALGVSEAEETPPEAAVLAAHGLLLIADRLAALKLASMPILEAALRELRRAQTIELP